MEWGTGPFSGPRQRRMDEEWNVAHRIVYEKTGLRSRVCAFAALLLWMDWMYQSFGVGSVVWIVVPYEIWPSHSVNTGQTVPALETGTVQVFRSVSPQ